MTIVDIEKRLEELDTAIAELKAVAESSGFGSDASLDLTERQLELEAEQEKLKIVLQRTAARS